ncbi:MAG TPA: hypothetical protein VMU31_09290 [Rhizomicrobium sp.]|nr:hypothetical protein [Rhizomicrobium sp.]
MLAYRFYVLKADGKIETASNHECADDGEALNHARKIIGRKPIECWQGARKMFLLHPDGTLNLHRE